MDERIRVAQLFITFDIENIGGGHSRFALDLGNHLDPERFDVMLCSLGFDTDVSRRRIEALKSDGRKVFVATDQKLIDRSKPLGFITKCYKALSVYFNQYPVDILHSHAEFTDILALGLKSSSCVPRIMRTVHIAYPIEWVDRPARRILFTNFLHPIYFDREIGINRQNTDRLNRRLMARLLKRKAILIHNAVDLARFESQAISKLAIKQSLGIPENAFVIGSIGRLDQQKGYSYLIEAFASILRNHPDVILLIVGDGPLANRLLAQTASLGMTRNVIFTGSRPDIHQIFSILDLFVSSSIWEGFPTVILESMACNIPVLATDNPGTSELVQHGQTGWLVPPKSSSALADGIETMMNSKDVRKSLTENAQKFVNICSIDKITKQYEDLYFQLHKNVG